MHEQKRGRPRMRKQALGNDRKAAWTHGRSEFTHVARDTFFLNNLSGDFHANVTCVRHNGGEKN
jgi:hypothetical protein